MFHVFMIVDYCVGVFGGAAFFPLRRAFDAAGALLRAKFLRVACVFVVHDVVEVVYLFIILTTRPMLTRRKINKKLCEEPHPTLTLHR